MNPMRQRQGQKSNIYGSIKVTVKVAIDGVLKGIIS